MRGRLSTNVLANVTTAAIGLGAAAVSTPIVIGELGKAAFGIWTLVASIVIYIAIAESGFGPAIQRFVAVARGQGEQDAPARLLWTVVLAYVVIGALACLALQLLSGPIVNAFDFPAELDHDARSLLSTVGIAIALSLLATGLGNVLFGLERFVVGAVSAAIGAAVLLLGILVGLAADGGLPALGIALVLQHSAVLVVRVVALCDVIISGRPALASRSEVRAILGFSARLQLSALSVLINGQSDKVVVGLVAPATTVAQLGVASQVAEAGRLVGGAMLPPIISRLAVVVGQGDHERLSVEYRRLSGLWIMGVTGATAVGLGMLHPLLISWLGEGFDEASLLGAVLVLAYGINVLTGIGSAYLRAIGSIGLEARAGVYMVIVNAALTIPLALAAGARGVVLGTLGANIFGSGWFFWRLHRVAPVLPREWLPRGARCLALATLAGAAAFGLGLAAASTLPRFIAMVPVILAAVLAFAAFLSAMRIPLRPSALRGLIGAEPVGAGR